jgi:anti-sigma factor RsiW
MLTCKELVAHSSDYLDGQLNLRGRLAVRAHLALCGHCRRFVSQMRLSQGVLRKLDTPASDDLDALASRLAKARREQP